MIDLDQFKPEPLSAPPDGAFEIGGGEYQYGQLLNQKTIESMFSVPKPDNVFDAVKTLREALHKLPATSLKSWQDYIGGSDEEYKDKATSVETIVSKILHRPPGGKIGLLQRINDVIHNMVWGWEGDNHEEGKDIWHVHKVTADIAGAIDTLNKDLTKWINSQATGNSAFENFTLYTHGTLGPNWTSWYKDGYANNIIYVDNGKLRLPYVLLSVRSGFTRYTPKATLTDYQRVSATFGSAPQSSANNDSANYILGRVSSSAESNGECAFAKITQYEVILGHRYAGVEHVWDRIASPFNAGSVYHFDVGVKSAGTNALYTYRISRGNNVLLEARDYGKVVAPGVDSRYTGLGFFNPNMQSGTFTSFAMHDN